MTLPRRTFGCSGEVLSTLSILIATKSPILNSLTLPLDSFIFLLYFCCCPVMYSSVAFLLCGFSGEVPGWSAAEDPIVLFPEPFGLLVDSDISLNSVTVPEFVSSSHSSTWSWTWFFLCRGISFQGSVPNTTSYGTLFIALCNEMFFLYAASLRTLHHLFKFWCWWCSPWLLSCFVQQGLVLLGFWVPQKPVWCCALHTVQSLFCFWIPSHYQSEVSKGSQTSRINFQVLLQLH